MCRKQDLMSAGLSITAIFNQQLRGTMGVDWMHIWMHIYKVVYIVLR